MKSPRWQAITESEFPWERDALDWLLDKLPDAEPWHAWSNFEFIDDDGKVNEVDALIIAPGALWLIEIKSRPGVLTGDAHTWTWKTDGREYSVDHPIFLANRKAKRLASLLKRQPSFVKSRERLPWVEPAIFLSATDLTCKLEGPAAAKVYQRGQPGTAGDSGIVAALYGAPAGVGYAGPRLIDRKQAGAIVRALGEAGIRPSIRARRVGDYRLDALLGEGSHYQDWAATHVSVDMKRRMRLYSYGKASNREERQALARQARREFQILEGIEHPGVLKVLDFKDDSDLGPALLFEYDPNAQRLDHFLQRRHAALDIGQRLFIVRELAEALRYAHKRRLYHRGLNPASVLVRETGDAARPFRLQIMNWQTGSREAGTTGTLHTIGTRHVDEYVEDAGQVYLAPEALHASAPAPVPLDVFALGALTWSVLTGTPPAANATELYEKLRRGSGLQLSDVLDGTEKGLQDLVAFSTHPDVSARMTSVDEFIEYLDEAEDELTAPATARVADPATARSGDVLGPGLVVVRSMGLGSAAHVLLVKREGSDEELVLKVATEPRYDERVAAEGETLRPLRHPNIVSFIEPLEIAGRQAFLMRKAGDRPLSRSLREEGRLSLDLLRRYGEELLEAVRYLEDEGVAHRDIKPDNLGIATVGERGKRHIVLFDFSLSRTPVDNLQAGTPGYLDPFLRLRKPPRWDLYAERYAAAVTLHEMATGTLPVWGDGSSAPDVLDCEVTLSAEAFDPNVRDGLRAFFERALRRDARERYDNAEEMLRAWRRVFDEARHARTTPDALDAIARLATADTTLAELGYSVEAQDVLDRMDVHRLRDLLAVERMKFQILAGVSDKVRKEIRDVAKRLVQLRPDLVPGGMPSTAEGAAPIGGFNIDQLAALLLPKRPAGDDRPQERVVALYLGLEGEGNPECWRAIGEVARQSGLTRSRAGEALVSMTRERWLKTPQLTAVRDEMAVLMEAHGGVMTASELGDALLAQHGSAERDDVQRLRLSLAVVRAAVETEQQRSDVRFQLHAMQPRPLIAVRAELADYARRLGEVADRISTQEPLLAPATALRELQAVPVPAGVVPLAPQRLLRLATAASHLAAISSRSEIYQRGMSPLQALRQSLGALMVPGGKRPLTVQDIELRVRGRYPLSARLPGRPDLDRLLREVGADLVWRPASSDEAEGYVPSRVLGVSAGSTTLLHRQPTRTVLPAGEVSEEVAAARLFEQRLERFLRAGGFLALTVAPREVAPVQTEITTRFRVPVESLDELVIGAMIAEARALEVEWDVVLDADRVGSGADWANLLRLAARAGAQVRQSLLNRDSPVLLAEPGLVGRYQLMSLITDLQAAAGRPGRVPAVILLVPMQQPSAPVIGDVTVPVVTAAQWARVPRGWIENRHRTQETT